MQEDVRASKRRGAIKTPQKEKKKQMEVLWVIHLTEGEGEENYTQKRPGKKTHRGGEIRGGRSHKTKEASSSIADNEGYASIGG